MATLILGTVGRVLGGPLGGLAGTLLGGGIDQAIFGGGKTREGPRVANLAVQSAAYGEPLPRLYGRMRVAGNLVWTAGIRETQSHVGGGKRGPATNTYSYSASFAVIVAARPIADIGRIWADGKLLRAADGGFIYPATVRTYLGSEAQPVDPLIAAAESAGMALAYRGRAYVVFEDLPLADYGNRIPNLTFEVVADAGDGIALDTIVDDVAAGSVRSSGVFAGVAGFAAIQAGTVRQTLASLAQLTDLSLRDDGFTLVIDGSAPGATTIRADDIGIASGAAAPAGRREIRLADAIVPDALSIAYSDPSRDFQAGLQRAIRRTPAVRIEQRELPVALAASDAKTLAGTLLRRAIAARTTAVVTVPWRYAGIHAGEMVRIGGDADVWRVTHRTISGATIDLELVRLASADAPAAVADGGRALATADVPQGVTTLHVLDLPPLPGPLPTTPRLLLAAAGADGWRRADIVVSRDGGASYAVAATAGFPATIGRAAGVLGPGAVDRWDRVAAVDVELIGDAMSLDSVSEAAVLAGANLALVGDEIIQFAQATSLGPRRYRLSTLLRGRRGTERAIATHAAGDRFVVLDSNILPLDLPVEAIGAALTFKAIGAGETSVEVAPVAIVPAGVALRPLSPSHLRVGTAGDGD